MKSSDFLSRLPSVQELLDNPQVKSVVEKLNQSTVATRARGYLKELSADVQQRSADLPLPSLREIVQRVTRYVAGDADWGRHSVVNATGRFRGAGHWVSTPLAEAAIERLMLIGRDFAVEREATRGSNQHEESPRSETVELICQLTGADAAIVLNSHASAISAVLGTVAGGRSIAVARGELGSIEPGCRFIDLCQANQVELHEVGATDIVSLSDYQSALGPAAILVLTPADYELVGGATKPSLAEIAGVARERNVPFVVELGGTLLSDSPEVDVVTPTAQQAIASGADLVIVRGEGLIGGPACSLVLGKGELIRQIQQQPTSVMSRPDPFVAATLAATLQLHAQPDRARFEIPVLSLLTTPIENLRNRAERLATQIAASQEVATADVVERPFAGPADLGVPLKLESVAIAIRPAEASASQFLQQLAAATPRVCTRLEGELLLLDLRTVFPRQDLELVAAFSIDDPYVDRQAGMANDKTDSDDQVVPIDAKAPTDEG